MLEAAESAGVTNATGFNYYCPRWRSPRSCWPRDGSASSAITERSTCRTTRRPADNPARRAAPARSSTTPRRHAPVPRRRAGVGRRNDVEARLRRRRRVRRGVRARRGTRRRAGGVTRRDRLEGAPSFELNGSDGSIWWDMEDPNRLHVFFTEDERDGLGGFRDVPRHQPEHPFLAEWWPPGHVLGWEHSFVHEWRDFLEAVLDERAVPDRQASFEDGYRAAVLCEAIHTSAREGNASRSQVHAQRFERKQGGDHQPRRREGCPRTTRHRLGPGSRPGGVDRAVSRHTLLRGAALGGAARRRRCSRPAAATTAAARRRPQDRNIGRERNLTFYSSPTVSRGTSSGRSTGTASRRAAGLRRDREGPPARAISRSPATSIC